VAPAPAAPARPAVRRNFAASHRVAPAYPERARARGITGMVVADVMVQPDGSVAEVRIVSANPPRIFDQEVVRALMQWKFNPEPTGFIGEYEINFKLND
jgi:protein TonB